MAKYPSRYCVLPILFQCFALLLLIIQPIQVAAQIPCGEQLDSASYQGVVPKSNGDAQGSGDSCADRGQHGLQYQCVEFVRRFYAEALGIDTSSWRGRNAVDFFDDAGVLGLTAYTNGESSVPPAPDDIIVFNSSTGVAQYGHVAIVTAVSSSTVSIIEQNWSWTGTANLTLVQQNGIYTINRRGNYGILGWLRHPSTVPQGPWLSFIEGNPGIPGDGIFISSVGGHHDTTFSLSNPFPLGGLTDGLTVTVYPPSNIIQDPDFNIDLDFFTSFREDPYCRWGVGGAFPGSEGTTVFNGAKGFFISISQELIIQEVTRANQYAPACNFTAEDFFLIVIWFNNVTITTLDAAIILPGQNAIP